MTYAANDALVVIDMQHDFMPYGALPVAGGDELVKPIGDLMRSFPGVVVMTQDWHPPLHQSFASQHGKAPFETIEMYGQPQVMWPDHCVQGTSGAGLHGSLPIERANVVLRKGMDPAVDSYSAFNENYGPAGRRRSTGLLAMLLERVVRRVFLCGLARDFCVLWSAQDCSMTIPTTVLWNLTRSVNPANDEETSLAYKRAGVTVAT